MIDHRVAAIYLMCASVITLYALKEGHTRYLPDLAAMGWAFLQPRQSYAIGAVIIAAIIRHSPMAYTLADIVPSWLHPLLLPGARNMSIDHEEIAQLEEAYKTRISEPETDDGNTEEPQPVAEKHTQQVSYDTVAIMAKSVLSGMLTIGEATRLASGSASGRKYQTVGRRIKAEVERQSIRYVPLTPEKQQKPKVKT